MTPPNIVAFTRVTKEVLSQLYQAFPEPIVLRAPDLLASAEVGAEYRERVAQPGSARMNLAATTLRFLECEGFIRFGSEVGGVSFQAVVLTAKGFAALRKTPEVIDTKASIGDRLIEPLAEGAIAGLIQLFFS